MINFKTKMQSKNQKQTKKTKRFQVKRNLQKEPPKKGLPPKVSVEPNKNRKIKEPGLMLDIVTRMKCPKCKVSLSSMVLCNVEVDYCPKCFGLWFEEEELRLAKDEKDKNLQWLDIDLWKDETKFKISYGIRICPSCRVPLYEVYYGKSGIIVDVCNLCHGIWLDRGEFTKIINWLKEKADYEILHNYAKNLFEEFAEIFIGPETLREEILDFLAILKLLNYKFTAQHPVISKIISQLPK